MVTIGLHGDLYLRGSVYPKIGHGMVHTHQDICISTDGNVTSAYYTDVLTLSGIGNNCCDLYSGMVCPCKTWA